MQIIPTYMFRKFHYFYSLVKRADLYFVKLCLCITTSVNDASIRNESEKLPHDVENKETGIIIDKSEQRRKFFLSNYSVYSLVYS
jgi:hypothetical protein